MTSEYLERRAQLLQNYSMSDVNPPYLKATEFEKFNYPYWREWMEKNWSLSLYFIAVYLVVIFGGKQLMKARDPFVLRKPLILWNIGLAVFSAIGFQRNFLHLTHMLGTQENAFHASVCSRDGMPAVILFWELLGTWSKAAELGDTVFIVLKKNPLIFLHWYHHISVLFVTWFAYDSGDPYHRWPMTMNLGIHAVMYSYYALRAAGFKIPKAFSMCLTATQLLQMVVGVTLNIYSLYAFRQGWDCARREINVFLHLGMYLSYMVLFANFFIQAYFKGGRTKSKLAKSKTS